MNTGLNRFKIFWIFDFVFLKISVKFEFLCFCEPLNKVSFPYLNIKLNFPRIFLKLNNKNFIFNRLNLFFVTNCRKSIFQEFESNLKKLFFIFCHSSSLYANIPDKYIYTALYSLHYKVTKKTYTGISQGFI